jgi:hypothetical protein
MKILVFLLIFGTLPVLAEDWTVNGKTYHGVTVTEINDDVVVIQFDMGIAHIALADLPADLQSRFHYDPAKAKQAAEVRAQQETKVEANFQAEVQKASIQKAQEEKEEKAAATTKANQEQMIANAVIIQGTVLEKTDAGIIIECDAPEVSTGSGGIGDGYGGGSSAPIHHSMDDLFASTDSGSSSAIQAKYVYGTFFLTNYPKEASVVDGNAISIKAYPTGPYSYTTVQGARATVASYTAILPDQN